MIKQLIVFKGNKTMLNTYCTRARILLCAFILMFIVGCSGELTDVEYVQRARDALDKNDYAAAVIDLKSALVINSNNAEARWELGKIYLKIGSLLAAQKELLAAQKLGVDEEYIAPLLAQVYLPLGKYDEVHALSIKPSKPSYSQATEGSMLASRALAFLAEGHVDSAQNTADSAMKLIPDSSYAQYVNAVIVMNGGNLDAARQALDEILQDDKEYAPAWSLLGDLERRVNNMEAAETAYGNAIRSRLNNANDRLNRAMVRIYQNKLDLAQKDIDALKKRTNKSADLYYAEGLVLYLKQDYTAAQEPFDKVVNMDKRNNAAMYYLGAIHYRSGHVQQAQNYLSKVVSKAPNFLPARKLLAAQNLEIKQFASVEELLLPVVNEKTEDLVLIKMFANALMGQGKNKEGLIWLKRAEQLEPASAEAKARLAQGLLITGDEVSASDALSAAIQLDPKSQQADVLLVYSYLRTHNYDAGLQAAEDFVVRQPENPTAHNLVGLALLTLKRVEPAKQAFERALALSSGHSAAGQNLAQLAISDSDFEKARALYEQILLHNPNDMETLIKFAALEARLGNNQQMRGLLKQAIEAHPEALEPKVILAKTYLVEKKPNKAVEIIGDAVIGGTATADEIVILGQAQMQNGAYLEASHTFLSLIEKEPKSAQAHFLLGVSYAHLGEGKKMEQAFIRTLELDDNHILARIALTKTQILHQDFDKARDNLRRLKAVAPDAADILKIEAAINAQSEGIIK